MRPGWGKKSREISLRIACRLIHPNPLTTVAPIWRFPVGRALRVGGATALHVTIKRQAKVARRVESGLSVTLKVKDCAW